MTKREIKNEIKKALEKGFVCTDCCISKTQYPIELGVNIIIENKDMIINPSNWYWCDKNNRIIARVYYESR